MNLAKILKVALICGLFFLQGINASRAAGTAVPIRRPAAAPPGACHPLIREFGETICHEDVKLENTDLSKFVNIPEKQRHGIEQQALETNLRMVKNAAWHKALVHRFGADAVTPSDEEIENYRQSFNGSLDASYAADRKTVDLISDLLAKNNYTPANEKAMRSVLSAAKLSLKLYGERQQHTEGMPEQYKFVVDTAERQMARNLLTTWKSDKILYETYGGHLVMGEATVVPVDAYGKFLKYIREDGKLEIVDPEYKDVFKETEDFLAAKHPEAEDEDISANYFSSPTWQFGLANSDSRVEDLRKKLLLMKTLGPREGVNVSEEEIVGKQSRPGRIDPTKKPEDPAP